MRKISLSLLIFIVSACSNPQFDQLGSTLLGSTGLVSSSQASALFSAGGKLAKAATPLSEEEEYYLGRGVSAVILSRYQPLRNQPVQNYVSKVGATVAAYSNRPETFSGYHFMVLDSAEINAVSAPGGFVFISSGFLKLIHNEDELASVLAHEVGHIALGHGVKAISQSNLTQAVTILGKEAATSSATGVSAELVSVFGDSIKDVTNTLLTKGYSRGQEYDADHYAAELLKSAGYNSHELVSMLTTLQAQGESSTGWYSTHPTPKKRISEVSEYLAQTEAKAGEETRTRRFKSALKSLV